MRHRTWLGWSLLLVLVACGRDPVPPPGGRTVEARGVSGPRSDGFGIASLVEEGVVLRARWSLPSAPDSQRFTVKDSLAGNLFANSKVNRTHRTATASVPAIPVGRRITACIRAWKTGTVLLNDCIQYAVGQGEVIEVPADTTPPVTIDTSYRTPSPVASLPRVWAEEDRTAPTGKVWTVGASLQSSIDSARTGDVVEMDSSKTFTGAFRVTLPGITLRTKGYVAIPGVRADSLCRGMAKVRTLNSASVLSVANTAHNFRAIGVCFGGVPAWKGLTYAMVNLGGTTATLDSVNRGSSIISSVIYAHDSMQTQRCLAFFGAHQVVVDSHLDGCKAKGYDAQAVFSWNGPGPFKIDNNYLAGSGENIMFGGADPRIPGLIPSDIRITRNDIVKPLWWKGLYTIKNHLESKNSQRVLVDGNNFVNTWKDGQLQSLILKSENQSGGCTWCFTGDWIYRRNRVKNAPVGAVLTGSQVTVNGGPSVPAKRIHIYENHLDSVSVGQLDGRWTFQIGGNLSELVIERNIFDGTTRPVYFSAGETGGVARSLTSMVFRDNIFKHGTGGFLGDGASGVNAITRYCPTCIVTGNKIVGGTAASYPPGNTTGLTWEQATQ